MTADDLEPQHGRACCLLPCDDHPVRSGHWRLPQLLDPGTGMPGVFPAEGRPLGAPVLQVAAERREER